MTTQLDKAFAALEINPGGDLLRRIAETDPSAVAPMHEAFSIDDLRVLGNATRVIAAVAVVSNLTQSMILTSALGIMGSFLTAICEAKGLIPPE